MPKGTIGAKALDVIIKGFFILLKKVPTSKVYGYKRNIIYLLKHQVIRLYE